MQEDFEKTKNLGESENLSDAQDANAPDTAQSSKKQEPSGYDYYDYEPQKKAGKSSKKAKSHKKFWITSVALVCVAAVVICAVAFGFFKKDTGNEDDKPKTQVYSVTYVLGGGINSTDNAETYVSGDNSKSQTLFAPTKTGYEFDGWYLDEECTESQKIEEIDGSMTGDITVYASWKLTKYSIEYEIYGGENNASNKTTYTIESSNIELFNPTKTGYTFGGWFTSDDFKTRVAQISAGSTGNKKFYAKFTPVNYNIEYVYVKNSTEYPLETENPISYNIETAETTLGAVQRDGYSFDGWYLSENYLESEKVEKILSGWTGNKKFYAKFSLVNYNIYLHNEDNQVLTDSYNIETGKSSLFAPSNKVGYDFVGWFDYETYSQITTLSETELENQKITKIGIGVTGDIDLYAYFVPKTFTIYLVNDGQILYTKTVKYKHEIGELPALVKDGFEFLGWEYVSDSGVVSMYESTMLYERLDDLTLTASWRANDIPVETFTVTFDANGGSEVASVTAQSGDKLTQPETTKNGYYVDAWLSDGSVWNFSLNTVSSNMTLTARWKLVVYEINYNLDNGVVNGNNPSTYTIASNEIRLESPDRGEDYIFLGWYTDPEYNNEIIVIENGSTGNLSLYAKWQSIDTSSTIMYTFNYNLSDTCVSHLFANKPAKEKAVGSFVDDLPQFRGEISKYFRGFYYNDPVKGETKIEGNNFRILEARDLEIYAKWDKDAIRDYYYNDNMQFAIDYTNEDNVFAYVSAYDGDASIIIIPKYYVVNEIVDGETVPTAYEVKKIGNSIKVNDKNEDVIVFYRNKNIKKLVINSNVLEIYKDSFKESGITEVDFSKINIVGENAFASTQLTEVVVGNKFTLMEKNAFANCSELKKVDFTGASESFMTIPESAFYNCTKLNDVRFKSTISYISHFAFAKCESLADLSFLKAMPYDSTIGNYVFMDCTLATDVELPYNIVDIGFGLFENVANFNSVKMYYTYYENTTDTFAFIFGNSNVKTVEFVGTYITNIPQSYFNGLSKFETFVMGDTIEIIGDDAFAGCVKLKNLVDSEGNPHLSNALVLESFSIDVLKDTEWYSSFDYVLVIGGVAVYIPSTITNVVIDDGVTAISTGAATGNTAIREIVIPTSVKTISNEAFSDCTNLEKVTFADDSELESIGDSAFENCYNLAEINLEKCTSLTSIGAKCFSYVGYELETDGVVLSLPESLETLGSSAFLYAKLKKINSYGDNFGSDEYGVLYQKTEVDGERVKTSLIYCPSGLECEIYVIPKTVTIIYSSSFVNVENLKFVFVRNNLVIRSGAFLDTYVTLIEDGGTISFARPFGNPTKVVLTPLDAELYEVSLSGGGTYEVVIDENAEINEGYYSLVYGEKVLLAYIIYGAVQGDVYDITDFVAKILL